MPTDRVSDEVLNGMDFHDLEGMSGLPGLAKYLEELRANDRRYRWLKQSSWTIKRYVPAVYQDVAVSGGDLDAAIDAATEVEHG